MQGSRLSAHVSRRGAVTRTLLDAFAAKIHAPYLAMAGLLGLLAVGVLFSPLPEIDPKTANASAGVDDAARDGGSIFRFPHLWLGALCIFAYVGAEVMAGDAIVGLRRGVRPAAGPDQVLHLFHAGRDAAGYVSA